jgi:YtcA family
MNANGNRRFVRCAFALAPLLLTSCGRVPAVDILGSFFPAWLVCLVAAILLTALCRFVLLRFHMNFDLPALAYPSLATVFTFALWLIFFQ